MIINAGRLLTMGASPIKRMRESKGVAPGGTTYGLGEAGYDIRIKQEVRFYSSNDRRQVRVIHPVSVELPHGDETWAPGRFTLASAIEEFHMPSNLVGIVHDKSTWARRGLSVFNTVIEPGWKGFLTLELVFHGEGELIIPAGAGIAQVVFHETAVRRTYAGKYQNQEDRPVAARDSV